MIKAKEAKQYSDYNVNKRCGLDEKEYKWIEKIDKIIQEEMVKGRYSALVLDCPNDEKIIKFLEDNGYSCKIMTHSSSIELRDKYNLIVDWSGE